MRLSPVAKFSLALLPFVIAAAARAASEPSSAPEDFYNLSLAELGQVEISIATGNSTPLDRAPAAATVITASEIEALGARSLNEVLESVPGLHVGLSSLSRLDSVYSIRGIHTGFNSQVLLMINGVAVQSSLQGGRPSLLKIPASGIDRVEVIRGPGSAVYGADAYAGVINVITKDASVIDSTKIGGGAGAFGSRDLWLQTANQWRDWGVSLSMAYQESNGDSDRVVNTDLQSLLDRGLGTTASNAPGALSTRYQIVDTHLTLTSEKTQFNLWSWISNDAGVGAGGAQALDINGSDESNLLLMDATYHFDDAGGDWDNSARFSYLYYDLQTRFTLLPANSLIPIGVDGNVNAVEPAGLVSFPDGLIGQPGQESVDTQLDLISIYSGWESHRIRFAVGSKHQTLEAREYKNFGPGVITTIVPVVSGKLTDVSDSEYVFLPDSSRTIAYFSLQDEWQITSSLELTSGVRYDDYSDFGGTTNPRIALVWAGTEQLTTKLMYGSAFRAPSFTEQGSKNNPVSLGNSDLDPEQIDTVELSFNYLATKDFQTSLTLFRYQARDMIEFVSANVATIKMAQNARDQDGDGFELEMNWKPLSSLHFSSSYSYQDAKDVSTNQPIADAPGQQIKVNMNWEFAPDWSLNNQWIYVADRERRAGDIRPAIDDYTWVDLVLTRKNIIPQVDASFAVRNLGDADAREPSSGEIADDYPLESRSVWLQLSYQFD
ncbi:TonB-dependent receptor [Cellvibrio sp. KY-GH-1]|uniref:TonB-dependent receptor plug domain-containing protein n=1 Tax=Cellvibrio sp. KY-GH-1 TaxID=2303332 RepID=UPI0012454DD7|nr:TonB-dependent receptor [Cellvibrio sp. KY-GH-1]QEY18381.1 TonB-dependent receptor [Cellvibrio sp. KY-GH-1]